jgi:tight adherence protein B
VSALTWFALAGAAVLAPIPAAASARVRALADRDRPAPGRVVWRPVAAGTRIAAAPMVLVATATLVVGVAVVGGPAGGVAAAIAAVTTWRLASDARTARTRQQAERELLAGTRQLIADLEAGARPASALTAAAETASAYGRTLGKAARAAGDGSDVTAVLGEESALGSIANAWHVAQTAGAPLSDALGGAALDLAGRVEQRRAVATALSAARSTAVLLAVLPLLGIALGAAMGARPLAFLLGSSAGRLVGCVGVTLDAVGLLWTQRVARRAEAGA